MTIKILGCGPSSGVPSILGWGDCDPQDARNRRTRSSAIVEINQRVILIDASPDLYAQLIREGIKRVDAVILSHFHADHVAGLVDVFFLSRFLGVKVPVVSDTKTITYLRRAFGFAFDVPNFGFVPHIVAYGGQDILGIEMDFFPLVHGDVQTIGVRFGNVAYCIDVSDFTPRAQKVLHGVEKLILPGRSFSSTKAHMSIHDAIQWCEKLCVRQGYLTNLGSGIDYVEVSKILPSTVSLCVDGQMVNGVM